MKALSKQEAIRLHRKMWLWIADKTLERKSIVGRFDYFREMGISVEDRPYDDCYCCEYDFQYSDDCSNCPLDWESETDDLMCVDKYEMDDDNGLLKKWSVETDYKKCAEFAREIANLSERKNE